MREAILLVLGDRELYGLEIIDIGRIAIMPRGFPRLHQGNVYPELRAMEAEGVLVAREVDGPPERGGRPRFYYRKAAAGKIETRVTEVNPSCFVVHWRWTPAERERIGGVRDWFFAGENKSRVAAEERARRLEKKRS